MTVWELKNDGINHFAVLVFTNDVEVHSGLFDLDGSPKHWSVRPGVEPFVDKKGEAKPLADISYLDPGSVDRASADPISVDPGGADPGSVEP